MDVTMMARTDIKCPHVKARPGIMLSQNSPGLMADIPRLNRSTIFQTRSHITKGFHLNDGLSSKHLKEGKTTLPKLSVTSLSKVWARDFNSLTLQKPRGSKGSTNNSFDSRLSGKCLMSTAQYYELKKIYGDKPVSHLDRILSRLRKKGRSVSPATLADVGSKLQQIPPLTAISGTPDHGVSREKRDNENCRAAALRDHLLTPRRGIFTNTAALLDDKPMSPLVVFEKRTVAPTPEDDCQIFTRTDHPGSPCKVHLAPIRHTPSGIPPLTSDAQMQVDFVSPLPERNICRETQCPSELSQPLAAPSEATIPLLPAMSRHRPLPGLSPRQSVVSQSDQHPFPESPGPMGSIEQTTPLPTLLPTPNSLTEPASVMSARRILRRKLSKTDGSPSTDLRVVGNRPRSLAQLRRAARYLNVTPQTSCRKLSADSQQDAGPTVTSTDPELNVRGRQMKHTFDSHLLSFLNYSRDYRISHVAHPTSNCDRMESHWIANDLHMISRQKLNNGGGLLETDWGMEGDDDVISVLTRHTSSPTDEQHMEHLNTLLKSGSGPADLWLRNISMIIGCSSCSTSEFETFSSRSASSSSSVTVTTSTTDLPTNPLDSSDITEPQRTLKGTDASVGGHIGEGADNTKETTYATEDTSTRSDNLLAVTGADGFENFDHPKALSLAFNAERSLQENSGEAGTRVVEFPNMHRNTPENQSSDPLDLHRGATSCDLRSPISLRESPIGQILLANASKGKLPTQIKRQGTPIKSNSVKKHIKKHQRKTKIWRRKKRIRKSNSKIECRPTDMDALGLPGLLPDTPASSRLKRPGYLCFTPMYDSRYDQWKRKRSGSRNSGRRNKNKVRAAMGMEGPGDEDSDGCSDSDDGALWPSPGASTTVDPRSTSCTSDSDRETTDTPSSHPVSPPPEKNHVELQVPASRPSTPANGLGVNLSIITLPINKPTGPTMSTSEKSTETGKELKSAKASCTLPTVPEQPDVKKDKADGTGNKGTQTSSEPKENLAKKLKAIFKRKPASSIELDSERSAGKDRVSSASGKTSVWLTESLAVSSIRPPPVSEVQTARQKPAAVPDKVPKKPEKCSRAERPSRKVTLHEILRFLPNIGQTSEEPSEECSHDLTRVLPTGRRPDVTLCRSCICKLAMAQTAAKTVCQAKGPGCDSLPSRTPNNDASETRRTRVISDDGLSKAKSANTMPAEQNSTGARTRSLDCQPTLPAANSSVLESSATSVHLEAQRKNAILSIILPKNKPD